MHIVRAAAPPFFKNGFVVACERTAEAVLIDPGDEVDELLSTIREQRLKVTAVLLTHAHFDHVTGVDAARRALGAEVWLHPNDRFLYEQATQQGRLFGIEVKQPAPVDRYYAPDARFRFGQYVVDVLPTPGHCPGGVCLAIGLEGLPARELFVGDTLFAGSVGRTDLPGSDSGTLLASIRNVLFAFPDDTPVHPGHGPDTMIGIERTTNPFLI